MFGKCVLVGLSLTISAAFAQQGDRVDLGWLPWISANHLYSITGLEEFDAALYQQLLKGN